MDMEKMETGKGIAFEAVVQQLVVPTFVLGVDGKVLVWNRACELLTGMSSAEVVGTANHWRAFYLEERPCLADLIVKGRTDQVADFYASFDDSAEIYGGLHTENWCEMPLRQVNLYLSIDAGPIRDAQGQVIAVVETLRDSTAWKTVEDRQRIIESTFEHTAEGIIIADVADTILMVNPAFTEVTGYERDEAVGKTPRILRSGLHDDGFYREMWKTIDATGTWQGEVWNRRKNGEIYPQNLRINALRSEEGVVTHYVAQFSDVTSQKQTQERLEDMATHDALTGLPNRVGLSAKLHQALASSSLLDRLVAVCLIDLDSFKPVNDTYGHEFGDQLLLEVSQRLKTVTRASDTVARLGGDEFVMLLTEFPNMEEIEQTVGRVLTTLNKPVVIGTLRIGISASIGVTVHPFDMADTDTLLRHAAQAMYMAKNHGRNTWHMYDVADESKTQQIGIVLGQAREALQHGEFRLHYQPKVNLRTGQVDGMEALIRWQHPERGMVPPGEFLPHIENTPLIIELGEWVMREALAQVARWQNAGLALKVSVNIAARQLQHIDFVMRLRSILAQYPEVPPSLFEIEVLESTALEDVDNMRDILLTCQEMGIDFSLDDFGTGYSTLTYLRHLPAGTLKIDQSFIRDMLDDKEDLALIEGVIGLATVFNMDVIAEGVETIEQGIVLMRIGCDRVQGYYIARPMPAAEVPDWIAAFRPDPVWQSWAESAWDRSNLPLVLAEYDHLKWVQRLLALCADKQVEIEPEEIGNPHACRFGQWYDGEGRRQYEGFEAFVDIDPIHRRIHETASEILRLRQNDARADLSAQIESLTSLKDAIVDRLGTLRGLLLSGNAQLPSAGTNPGHVGEMGT